MPNARIRSRKDNMKMIFSRIEKNSAQRLDYMANLGAYFLRTDIRLGVRHGGTRKSWANSLNDSTGASAQSVYYVLTNGESTYQENASMFRGLAGPHYAGRSLEDVIFDEFKPDSEPNKLKSSFASLSLIVAFWEYGHHNKFTGKYESMPILSWTAFILMRRLPKEFLNIMEDRSN